MRFVISTTILLVIFTVGIFSQNNSRIMFYNVENLFDTMNDPHKEDDDFLEEGFMRWIRWKYWQKLQNISRVITAVGGMQSPTLVGLCEIENDSVLYDLTKRSSLKAQNYEYIITDSPDDRGIDVALLYQRHQFKPLQVCEYEVKFSKRKTRPTRNILHVVGEMINGKIMDVFVCHFPSRSGGQKETEPARIETALLLKTKTDSLFALREKANILIMGDFNDHPDNKSLSMILKAESLLSPIHHYKLYNLFYHRRNEMEFGSYKYQGKWEILDQFIVSGNMLEKENEERFLSIENNEVHVYKADFLLEDDKKFYGNKPFRTNLGPRYIGGFSDHLPIYIDLTVTLDEP